MPRPLSSRLATFCAAFAFALALISSPALCAEKWTKVEAPRFTVISNADEAEVMKAAEELRRFLVALGAIISINESGLPPLTVVMFRREKEFRPYRPLAPNGKPRQVAGFFARRPSWAVFGLAGANLDDDTRQTVYHEAVHWFLSANDARNPVWLEEGLAEVFSTFQINARGESEWGAAIPHHVRLLQAEKPIPLRRLINLTQSDPLFNENLRTSLFYAGSWAFLHYLIFSAEPGSPPRYTDFMTALRSGALLDEVFQTTFKTNLEGMDKALARYLRSGSYSVARTAAPVATTPLQAGAASSFEIEVALARLAVGSGLAPLAERHSQSAAQLDPASPIPHELLGYAAEVTGNQSARIAAFEEAARLKSRDHQIYYNLALHLQQSDGPGLISLGTLSPADARRAADLFERSINCRRTFLPAFQGLGQVINRAETLGSADRAFLDLGLKQFPTDGDIRIGLAVLDWAEGTKDKARQSLENLLSETPAQPESVTRFARGLQEEWAVEERFSAITRLGNEGKYTEALAIVDAALEGGASGEERYNLAQIRRVLAMDLLNEKVNNALTQNRIPEARALLQKLIESDAPEIAKRQARELLEKLAQAQPPAP